MSKVRYGWWPYVKSMIRKYPERRERYKELQSSSVIAAYDAMPRGSSVSKVTELLAIRELPTTEQREFEAVRRAIAKTERYRDGCDRLRVIRLVLWDGSHTIAGAALTVPCSEATAKRWHGDFIKTVARIYGLLDSC